MALVNVTNVQVLQNPAKFTDPFKLQITFDCIAPGIKDELEWKLVYVGSAESEEHDQTLDSVLVGPITVGRSSFIFEAPAPDAKKIPANDLMDVTIILLTCHYKEKEFIRVGYYVNNYCDDEEFKAKYMNEEGKLTQNPPIELIKRNIAANQPRVTRFDIPWDSEQQKIPTEENSGLGDLGNQMEDESSVQDNSAMETA
mmetsp:Transcript_3404/g.7972  ORF Transcript_3404/g.7972 Transcript_3404/m.7972 type:complete len:199 (-) Transcript_3404:253-849(-)|eukprot:CAMPEP_0114516578 /NCGR_PEP_ID=MMETSP0109-20121206/17409_1 /TAXON_ID=29199 /ORGANISM="Chlorarachnion reptans, Strain CCCM449" /LENGTH=198 /DNA_ID=CAMNT_0001696989 /DNA_START=183 /DNA_END=779 /DNA_ORIENTATION=-